LPTEGFGDLFVFFVLVGIAWVGQSNVRIAWREEEFPSNAQYLIYWGVLGERATIVRPPDGSRRIRERPRVHAPINHFTINTDKPTRIS
jgi:hypothetical protein